MRIVSLFACRRSSSTFSSSFFIRCPASSVFDWHFIAKIHLKRLQNPRSTWTMWCFVWCLAYILFRMLNLCLNRENVCIFILPRQIQCRESESGGRGRWGGKETKRDETCVDMRITLYMARRYWLLAIDFLVASFNLDFSTNLMNSKWWRDGGEMNIKPIELQQTRFHVKIHSANSTETFFFVALFLFLSFGLQSCSPGCLRRRARTCDRTRLTFD